MRAITDSNERIWLEHWCACPGVFAFKYSPRPETSALHLDREVSEEVKSERLGRPFGAMASGLGNAKPRLERATNTAGR